MSFFVQMVNTCIILTQYLLSLSLSYLLLNTELIYLYEHKTCKKYSLLILSNFYQMFAFLTLHYYKSYCKMRRF